MATVTWAWGVSGIFLGKGGSSVGQLHPCIYP